MNDGDPVWRKLCESVRFRFHNSSETVTCMSVKKYCTSCEGYTVAQKSDVCMENCELLKSVTFYICTTCHLRVLSFRQDSYKE
jgi:hypothetical protein